MGSNLENPSEHSDKADKEGPPFFKEWRGMYWLVIVSLAISIALLALLTHVFNR